RLVESEVLSPMASLKPGQSYSFQNEWAVAKIGGNLPILDCSNVGVTCESLTVKDGKVTGRFGVFYTGTAEVLAGGKKIASIPVSFANPHAASQHGIGIVFQELSLVPGLTIAENIFANRQPVRALGWVDSGRMAADTRQLLALFEMTQRPDTLVRQLSVAQQQV